MMALLALGAFAVWRTQPLLGHSAVPGFDASAFNVVTLGTSSSLTTGNFAPVSDIGGRVAVFGNYTI